MSEILRIDYAGFLVQSDSRPDEFHRVDFALVRGKAVERCTCEAFQIGIPHLIAKGSLSNTVEHRRCKHIRRVREALTNLTIDTLVRSDPSHDPQNPTNKENPHALSWRR